MDFTFPYPSAYIAELVAAAGAYQGSQPGTSIRSDCKAGISTILKAAGGKRPKGPQGLITTFLLKPHVPCSLTWVGWHPDLKPEKVGRFEDEDFGIYFADKLAGKETLTPTRDGREVISTMVVNDDDIITDLLSVNRFTIRYIDTPARPLLKRIEEVHTNRVVAYKVRRDILRIPRPSGTRFLTNGRLLCTDLAEACPSFPAPRVCAYYGINTCMAGS